MISILNERSGYSLGDVENIYSSLVKQTNITQDPVLEIPDVIFNGEEVTFGGEDVVF